MKLYTRPRPNMLVLLRDGDEIATTKRGRIISTQQEYVDYDLRDLIVWSAVYHVRDVTGEEGQPAHQVTVAHARGIVDLPSIGSCLSREVIEVDPWSYLRKES